MFKTKSQKMQEIVERKLEGITIRKDDCKDVFAQTLIAQKVILEEVLRDFKKI